MADALRQQWTLWRYRIARWMIHGGLYVMPPGRARSEVSALPWTWGMKVTATVAAKRAAEAGAIQED